MAHVIGVLQASARSPKRSNCERLLTRGVLPALKAAGAEVRVMRLVDYQVAPCLACESCHKTGACVLDGREGDDFARFSAGLDELDALIVIAPIYFGGPSAQFKALLDRFQGPWSRRYALGTNPAPAYIERRPLGLIAVGGGVDEFGFSALETCIHSAFRMVNLELVAHEGCIGYREESGPEGDAEHEEAARAFAGWFADALDSGELRDMLADAEASRPVGVKL